MPIYCGKSADGSDMQEFEGFHASPDGKEWSNMPYPEKSYKKYEWKNRMKNLIKSKPTEGH